MLTNLEVQKKMNFGENYEFISKDTEDPPQDTDKPLGCCLNENTFNKE